MRILGGLDSHYSGQVSLSPTINLSESDGMGRVIGWCPQNDALFDQLTVEEHLELFSNLLSAGEYLSYFVQKNRKNNYSAQYDYHKLLILLNIYDKRYQKAITLSGGMKRRLALALALLGNPKILLLDEPTNACDSYTRELVRKVILSKRSRCAILVSTHHVDDVEIISDRVWFLNDCYLAYDGPVSDLAHSRTLSAQNLAEETKECIQSSDPIELSMRYPVHSRDQADHKDNNNRTTNAISEESKDTDSAKKSGRSEMLTAFLEFSTWDNEVKAICRPVFTGICVVEGRVGDDKAVESTRKMSPREASHPGKDCAIGGAPTLSVWQVPRKQSVTLQLLLERLDVKGLVSWSVASPSIYHALGRMYACDSLGQAGITASPRNEFGRNQMKKVIENPSQWITSAKEDVMLTLRHIAMLCTMRMSELYSHLPQFILTQLIIPFLVVFAVVVCCRDVDYPRVEITSKTIGGVGEVLLGAGSSSWVEDVYPFTIESKSRNRRMDVFTGDDASSSTPGLPAGLSKIGLSTLERILGGSLSWIGLTNSDDMFVDLYDTFYEHKRNRWASFVAQDTVKKWLESSVLIPETSLKLPIEDVAKSILAAQLAACPLNNTVYNSNSTSDTKKLFDNYYHLAQQRFHVNRTIVSCRAYPLYAASINYVKTKNFKNDTILTRVLKVSVFISLTSNITMLSNVTTDHAGPVYLKEMVPLVYSCAIEGCNNNQSRYVSYSLFSHPFPEVNLANPVYLERGYLGSIMLVTYMLLLSSVSVRFVTQTRSTGFKTQLHISGVTVSSYWIANYIFDTFLIFLTLLTVLFAILFGGDPIRSFFFCTIHQFPGSLFLASIILFSFAIVSSNYSFCVLSIDPLSSQLFALISTVSCGLFLKLFLSLHRDGIYFNRLSNILLLISPCYAFSSAMFDLFGYYTNQLGKSVGVLNSSGIKEVHNALNALMFQAIAYLFISIVMDLGWNRFRFLLNTFFDLIHNKLCNVFSKRYSPMDISGYRSRSNSRHNGVRRDWSATSLLNAISKTFSTENKSVELTNRSTYHRLQSELRDSAPLKETTRLCAHSPASSNATEKQYGSIYDVKTVRPQPSHTIAAEGNNGRQQRDMSCNLRQNTNVSQTHVINVAPLVSASAVCVEYPGRATLALSKISFQMEPTERVALIGINGGGKSTLFRTLTVCGNVPKKGHAYICGWDTVRDQWKIGAEGLTGYVPQDGGLPEFLTVREILHLYQGLRRISGSTEGSCKGIMPPRYLSYPVHALSGGNKRKLSVVLANLDNPPLLMLDEPTSGVDPVAAERIVNYLQNVQLYQGILFSSHRIDECVRVCDRVLMLYNGEIKFDGPMQTFDQLATFFYQIDILLPVTTPLSSSIPSSTNTIKDTEDIEPMNDTQTTFRISEHMLQVVRMLESVAIDPKGKCLRIVEYSSWLARLTCEKKVLPMSALWRKLMELKKIGIIQKYSFRCMDMEEILSIITQTMNSRYSESG